MASSPATTATFCATLVDEWVRLGVKHAVVSPGSRSTPMAIALANHPQISINVFHDERSAAFAALGIGLESHVPAILLCTSGTAAAHFFAAVIEANYAHIPMIVCTADRPPELQGVGAPQTIDQTQLYGKYVRKFFDAGVADDSNRSKWRSFARESFSSTVGVNRGACQVNLPFREPLVGEVGDLPPVDSHSPVRVGAEIASSSERKKLNLALRAEKGIIVAGNGIDQPRFILELASRLRWPVLADPRSLCRVAENESHGAVIVSCADVILRNAGIAQELIPEIVLRIGDPPVSKVANQWLAACKAEQIAVTNQPSLIDPDKVVTTHIVGSFNELFMELNQLVRQNHDAAQSRSSWLAQWSSAEEKSRSAIDSVFAKQASESSPLTEPLTAVTVLDSLPAGSRLVVSSSMPVRDLEWFSPPRNGIRVYSNRGVNGIDGVVSTAVGIAIASSAKTALIIGDVAMLHDSNGLLNIMKRNIDMKIVVVDNEGGGIFSFLPQSQLLEQSQFELLFGTPHEVDFQALAMAHGVPFAWASNASELRDLLNRAGTGIIGVRTNRTQNVVDHNYLYDAVSQALAK